MRVEKIESAARLAFLSGIPLVRHDRTGHQTRVIAQVCGVDVRTIQRDIKVLSRYQARLNEIKKEFENAQ